MTTFEIREACPSDDILGFYRLWAAREGWEFVPPTVESWSNAEWGTFFEGNERIDQLTAHWHDPAKTKSLRLVARCIDEGESQRVWVILSPFLLMPELNKSAPNPANGGE